MPHTALITVENASCVRIPSSCCIPCHSHRREESIEQALESTHTCFSSCSALIHAYYSTRQWSYARTLARMSLFNWQISEIISGGTPGQHTARARSPDCHDQRSRTPAEIDKAPAEGNPFCPCELLQPAGDEHNVDRWALGTKVVLFSGGCAIQLEIDTQMAGGNFEEYVLPACAMMAAPLKLQRFIWFFFLDAGP